MFDILDTAHAWFFDSSSHQLNGTLVIRLVEGIKGTERQFVAVGEKKLGPYFPVQVESRSRVVEVIFSEVAAFFAYDESYDTKDSELKTKTGVGRFLFKAESSSFRTFAEARTTFAQLCTVPVQEFLLCCEDRIFHVLSADAPKVVLLQMSPDLSVERTNTWSAS
jgi:hypothetical protein